VRVENSTLVFVESWEFRNVGNGEVTRADVDVVESFCDLILSSPGVSFFVAELSHSDGEILLFIIPEDVVSDMVKFDP